MAFKSFEFLVAWRYLKSKRKDGFISIITWLSLIGISLGVATLIIVMSVMNGFREDMLAKILGMNGHITVISNFAGDDIKDYKNVAKSITKIPSLYGKKMKIIPVIESQVMASANGKSMGIMLRGIDYNDISKITPLYNGLKGVNPVSLKNGELLLGTTLARKLGVFEGDEITVTTAKGNITAFGTVPRIQTYNVGGLFNTGMSTYDSNFLYMPLDYAQNFLDMEDVVNYIEVFIENPDDAEKFSKTITRMIGPMNRSVSWEKQNSSFVSALTVERNVIFLILTLIIIVASFNIISSLVMLVKDKSHDIAVLRTVGATRSNIMKIFFLSGSFIGVVGTISGVILGVLVSENIEFVRQIFQSLTGTKLFPEDIYFLSELPSKIDYAEVLWVVAMSLSISFLATIYPSRKAAKMQPIDVLRYE
ncbi:MAG: lipoprotein-releasing ABC transporter permease subunit [Alphaproteobacteria bacterium]|nr:lipoprotein-releasing ABC transporter permease subunit [Alphaproteobacteria bacterium]